MAHKIMRLMVLFLIPLGSYAQKINSLDIGDTIPPIVFKNVFNDPGASISLTDFRGKLIILDFWNKWCVGCVASFPEMEKLQAKFGDKIKVLLVTTDSNGDVVKLFKRVKLPSLPIVTGDTLLTKLFPHATVPHHVWINTEGVVQFITDGYNTTENNIEKVLEGNNLALHVKKEVSDFNDHVPFWQEGNGRLQKYIGCYSFGMKRIEENTSTKWSMSKDTINKTIGFKFLNISVLELYKMAFGYSIYYSPYKHINRVVFDVPRSRNDFKPPTNYDSLDEWNKNNLVCFESKWMGVNDTLAFQYLQDDVNKFFPYSVKVENREVLCYSLTLVPDHIFNTPSDKTARIDWEGTKFSLIHLPVSVLAESLNGMNIFDSIPVIDETGFNDSINISLVNAFKDIGTLEKQLLQNGFILKQKKKILPMMVISNKK
jgi:thiol-disulfide isomerase/thioredoxin